LSYLLPALSKRGLVFFRQRHSVVDKTKFYAS